MWDHGVLIETVHVNYLAGAIAGLCGGVAMAAAMAVLSVSVGQGPWQLPKRVAGTILGPRAKDGGAGVVIFGLGMHAVLSTGFGVLFCIIVNNWTHEFWMTGVAFALALWVLNYWGIQITPGGRELTEMKTSWLSPIAHVVYGAVLAGIAIVFATGTMR